MDFWRVSIKTQYRSYISRWLQFCAQRQADPQGLGYSSLNTARSALLTFICVDNNQSVGSHPLIKRFMKGVFSNRLALPKYNVIWDVSVVVNFLKTLYPHNDLSLLVLCQKISCFTFVVAWTMSAIYTFTGYT